MWYNCNHKTVEASHYCCTWPWLYLLAIGYRWFDLVIALIRYQLGYHDLQMRNRVVILCKVMTTTNFTNTTDNKNIKSQQVMFTHMPTWGSLLSLQLVHGNPHLHNNSMPDQFLFSISTMCLTSHPAPYYFCMIFTIFSNFNITTC